ncbi:MAG: hypothetical protein ACOYVD_01175 [Bacillota bacterium]
MSNEENSRHDLLLIIVVALFILFVTGFAIPTPITEEPIVIS